MIRLLLLANVGIRYHESFFLPDDEYETLLLDLL